ERRFQRRRRSAVRVGLLRQSGPLAEARASGADGPRLPLLEAARPSQGARVGAAGESRRSGRYRGASEASLQGRRAEKGRSKNVEEEGEGETVGQKDHPIGSRL